MSRPASACAIAALLLVSLTAPWPAADPPPLDLEGMEPEVARALDATRKALVGRAEDADAWGVHAATCHAHGLLDAAEAGYREARRLAPGRFEWAYFLAIVRDANGAPADEVDALFGEAAALRDDYAPLYLRRGRAASRHGRTQVARDALARAVALTPESALALRSLGQVELSLGQSRLALAHLQAAARLEPRDGATIAALARLFQGLGEEERAEAAARRARRLRPVDTLDDPVLEQGVDAHGVSARHLYTRAQAQLRRGEVDAASVTLERLRARRPDDADAWFLTAAVAARRSGAAQAIEPLERAIALDERHVRAHVELARIHAALGRPQPALDHYRRALKATPGDPALLAATAHLLATTGDMAGALALYQRLLEISPGEPAIHFNVATAHAQLGDLLRAREQFEESVRLDPDYTDAHYELGRVLERLGRHEEAREHYREAVRLDPSHVAGSRLRSTPETLEPIDERQEFAAIARALLGGSNRYLGRARLAAAERRLQQSTGPVEERVTLRLDLVRTLLESGEVDRAVQEVERAVSEAGDAPDDELFYALQRMRGLAYMRRAEVQNCVLRHNRDCCIFPLEGKGRHEEQEPARQARKSFEAILARRPDDLAVRWLLNVMAMALGDYPQRIPKPHRLPPESFESEEDVPRFPDVAPDLGVDAFDLCGGAAVDDFDGDGRLDIVASTYDPEGSLTFYRNDGENGFEDRSTASGLDRQMGGLNFISADHDGDGDADLFVLRGAWLFDDGRIRNSLLRNDGKGVFTDVTRQVGLHAPAYPTQAAAWGDFDSDGDLDLYVCNESRKFDPNDPADFPSQLYLQQDDGRFVDVARRAGVTNDRYCKGVAAGDYDDDGDLDLYVSNVSDNRLYRNEGDGTFRDVAGQAGVVEPRGRSFATWFFDYDNDGRLDLFVAGFDADIADLAAESLGRGHDAATPRLYRNQGNGTFADVTVAAGLARPFLPMGANFGDLDNDGYLDIYLATGDPSFESLMPNVMLRNDSGKRFQDVTRSGGFGHLQKGHGVAFGDLDNDGDQDIYHQLGGFFPGDRFHNALFANPGNDHGSFWLELVGTRSHRSGHGARVTVTVRGPGGRRRVHRAVGSVSSFGGSPRRQEIGVGDATVIERLEVFWPVSGTRQVFENLPPGRYVRVTEGQDEVELLDPPRADLPMP